ncbi:MAG: glycosyltransferase family 4 protein [Sulfobacillus sp.]
MLKILLSSHAFQPSIGGLEAVSIMLAREFTRAGHAVIVVTQTPANVETEELLFRVVRQPPPLMLLRLFRWADVIFHSHISLRTVWPFCFATRPWVVVHHGWVPRGGSLTGLKGLLKHFLLRWATGIAVSAEVAKDFKSATLVIHNPYDAEVFSQIQGVARVRDLIFVGRFVSDKGLPVLLNAMTMLGRRGVKPNLTVVGDGPERKSWRGLAKDSGLATQVEFIGIKQGIDLAKVLNEHRILVIPSLWNEPFGIVALEGMACGCVVVGSHGGGLKEAIGPGGLTFPNGDASALADSLETLLTDCDLVTRLQSAVSGHLAQHQPADIAARYLEVFERLVARGSSEAPCGDRH